MGMNNATNTVARIVSNCSRLGHEAQTAAFALSLLNVPARALCCWCAEHVEGEAHRLPRGGECAGCAYVGLDTLVVVPD